MISDVLWLLRERSTYCRVSKRGFVFRAVYMWSEVDKCLEKRCCGRNDAVNLKKAVSYLHNCEGIIYYI